MGSGSSVRAGRAFVELYVDQSKMVRGLKTAQARLRGFGTAVQGIGTKFLAVGGIITGALGGALKVFAAAGDQLDKMSKRTGVAANALAELGFAAEQSGANMDTVEKGLKRMATTLYDAGRGSKEAEDALAAVGLSIADLKGLDPQEQFQRLADGLNNIADESTKAALAQKLFGRAGAQLLPMLPDLAALRQEARDLRLAPSDESVRAAADVTDAFNRIQRVVRGVVFEVGAALAPAFLDLAKRIVAAAVKTIDFVRENKEWIITAAKLGVALTAVGGTLVALGTFAQAAAFTLGGLALVATPLGALVAVIAGLAVAPLILQRVADGAVALADAQRKLREEGDALRASHKGLFTRLQELADKQHLTSTEFSEASSIIDQLQGQYGDLGLSVDQATGKVNGLADAQRALTEAMREQTRVQLDKEIAEAEKNVAALKAHSDSLSSAWRQGLKMISPWDPASTAKRTEAWGEAALALDRLRRRRDALNSGDTEALTSPDIAPAAPQAPAAESKPKRRIFEEAQRRKELLGAGGLFGGLPKKSGRIFGETLKNKWLKENFMGGLPKPEKKPIFGEALKNAKLLGPGGLFGGLPEQKKKLEDIGANLPSAQGTFSAFQAARFGVGDVLERLQKKAVDVASKSEKHLADIKRTIRGPMLADNS